MKTETNKHDKCEVELTVTLDADEAKALVGKVERAFMREVTIPGFRKGKVPLERIRRDFAKGIAEETKRLAVNEYLDKAIKEAKLDVVAATEINDFTCDATGGGFTAKLDVKPEFSLPSYKGLKLGVERANPTDDDVQKRIETLRLVNAKYEDAGEGEAAAAGDFAQIDFSGTIDGTPIAEIAPEAKPISSATGFWLQIDEHNAPAEIANALAGMKAGETKEGVEVDFSNGNAPEAIKGKKGVYTITLQKFRRRILPDDAELAAKMKEESLEKLAETVKARLQADADAAYARNRRAAVMDALAKRVDFAVPESSVRMLMDSYIKNLSSQAQASGLSAEYFEKNRDQILGDAREMAVRNIRLLYVYNAIAKQENIECKSEEIEDKVVELLLANAED